MNFDATRVISPQEVGPTLTVTLFLTVSFHSSHDYYTINIKYKLKVLYDDMTSQQQNFVNEHYTCGTPGALQVYVESVS